MAKRRTNPLEDIIDAPLRSLSRAQRRLEQANLEALRSYMDEGPDGRLEPQTLSVELGGDAGSGQSVEIPLLSLVRLPSFLIDEASVEMVMELSHQQRPSAADRSQAQRETGAQAPATKLHCRLSSPQAAGRHPRMATLSMRVSIQARDSNEATSRLRERLNGLAERKASRGPNRGTSRSRG